MNFRNIVFSTFHIILEKDFTNYSAIHILLELDFMSFLGKITGLDALCCDTRDLRLDYLR